MVTQECPCPDILVSKVVSYKQIQHSIVVVDSEAVSTIYDSSVLESNNDLPLCFICGNMAGHLISFYHDSSSLLYKLNFSQVFLENIFKSIV